MLNRTAAPALRPVQQHLRIAHRGALDLQLLPLGPGRDMRQSETPRRPGRAPLRLPSPDTAEQRHRLTRVVDVLRRDGNEVSFVSTPGAIHSVPALASGTPDASAAFTRMAAFMRKHAGG